MTVPGFRSQITGVAFVSISHPEASPICIQKPKTNNFVNEVFTMVIFGCFRWFQVVLGGF